MGDNPTIEARLDALPRKVAGVMRGLWDLKHINDTTLNVVLDAGELGNDSSRLHAFLASYLSLTGQGVPVGDVIKMSKQHNKCINLWWSPSRWREQHDRLSRLSTLKAMWGDNRSYDMSAFEEHLPVKFPGYLIKSSCRLGMEGLRQRHCVASYDRDVAQGRCAIVAVFVDRVRWTVSLSLTGDKDLPLAISQVKSKFNAVASNTVNKRIWEALNIPLPKPTAQSLDVGDSPYWEANLRTVTAALRDLAVTTVTISFDGSCDSGAIDDAEFDGGQLAVDPMVQVASRSYSLALNGRREACISYVDKPLSEAVEDVANDYLDWTDVDWYNNDGGYGTLELQVAEGTFEAEIYSRYTDVESVHDNTIEIFTAES